MIDVAYIRERVKDDDLIAITREASDPSDEIQEDRINTAIADAVSLVVEKWSDKYDYPWAFEANSRGTQSEARLKRLHFDIARYFLYTLKYDDEEIKEIRKRYDEAINILDNYGWDKDRHFPGLTLSDDYRTGFSLDSFITNKTEEDIELHGIFEINS
jgi:phage gp36-like protein